MFGFRRNDTEREIAVTVTTDTFIRLALLTVTTIIILLVAKQAAHAIFLIVIAFFLSLALNTPVHWLSQRLPGKRRGSRSLATSLSFLIVVLILIGFLASIVPPLVRQTESFIGAAPRLVKDFRSQNSQTGRFIRSHHLEKQVDKFSAQLSARIKNSGGAAFSAIQKIGNSAFALLTIFVLTFMMLVEGPRWANFIRRITPDKHQARLNRVASDMYRVIRGYANGQVTLAALASLLIMPAVLLLHISYPAALVVVIFICGLIPLVGHTIGAIIVTTVALFHSTTAAIIILVYYILYQQIENYLIQPRIQANSTDMSPLLVFMSVVIGASLSGLVGGLLAIPVAGCLRILVLEYLADRKIISHAKYEQEVAPPKS